MKQQIILNAQQNQAIKAYWEGSINRRNNAINDAEAFWARGQMDGFERALFIVTGVDPFTIIGAAMKSESQPEIIASNAR